MSLDHNVFRVFWTTSLSNPSKSKTVYLIDDDADVRDSLTALLESYGYRTESFASPAEFLKDLPANPTGCVLVDLHMPGMGGLELIELLRHRSIRIPAILSTANGKQLPARLQQAGILTVLRKPVSDEDLLYWVEKSFADGSP